MRVSKQPQERRAELIDAARRLFDHRGVDKTRVSDIVREVGVAQGVFYYYFSSKEEMVAEVARQVSEEISAQSEAILADGGKDFYWKLAMMLELALEVIDQFLGDDATSLQLAEPPDNLNSGIPGLAGYGLVREGLQKLVLQGAGDGQVPVEYPLETLNVLIYGLGGLAAEKLPSRAMLYTLVEQGLHLPKNSLARHAPKSKKHA